ncbi:MAG: hypothetical protein GY953_42550, partial [bacterium]|nr:hypothetical protein [bacterium]
MTLVTFAQAICPTSTCGDDIRLPSGAEVRICMPDLACWNGNLVIYSHGFVSPTRPIEIPEEQLQLLDGTPIPPLVNSLGNAFAVTSFRTNGLVLPEAEEDLLD